MALKNVQHIRHSLEQRKTFKMKVLLWLENTNYKLAFANTVFHKRAMLLIFYAEYTKSVLEILL